MKKFLLLIMFLISFNLFSQSLENYLQSFISQSTVIENKEIIIDLSQIKNEEEMIYSVSYILNIIYYYQDLYQDGEYNNIILHTKDNTILINRKQMSEFFYMKEKEQNDFIIKKIREVW
jgi:hypothetical protein